MDETKKPEFRFCQLLMRNADLLGEFSAPRNADKKCGELNLRQIKAMKIVWDLQEASPDGTTLKRLAEEMKLTPGTVSELVDSLVRRDLLLRTQNPNDRREVRITLTKMSSELIHSGIENMNRISADLLKNFTPEHRDSLIADLAIIFEKLNHLKEKS